MSVSLNKPVSLAKTQAELRQEKRNRAEASRKAAARRVALKSLHLRNASQVAKQTGA